jgi:hypothetical protein
MIHPGQLQAFENRNRKENRPQPRRLKVIFQMMSFGDGTGYAGSDGIALPRDLGKQSSME